MRLNVKNCPEDGEKINWQFCCRVCDHVSVLSPHELGETWISCGKLNSEVIRIVRYTKEEGAHCAL